MVEVNADISEGEKRSTVNKKRTKEAISVLKKLNQAFHDNKTKKSLLEDSSESSVYLQVTLKKIPPKKMKSMIKVHLPHSLMTDTTEVCLITGDLDKKDKKADIEPTVLHYKELLKKYGVKGITEVVPLRQLRTEYKTFESKRQLSAAYDIFINDKKITGCLPGVLGKAFYDSRKFPIPINLATSNLKDQVEKAVSETVFSLSCRGNSCTSEVARLSMEDGDILENILSCIEYLSDKLPGKWANVLGLYIKTARSQAIPIYMSFDSANELKVKAPRHQEKVKAEELSTVQNAEVKVYRDGRLIVKNLPGSDDEEESCDNENILPNIKRIKTDDSSNKDTKKRKSLKPQKKTKELVGNTKESVDDKAKEESCDNEDNLPSIKRRKTKDSNEDNKTMEIKKRKSLKSTKKTKELVDNTKELVNNEVKEESCDNEDILPSIKRRKMKDSSNEDNKMIEIKKKKSLKPTKKTKELVDNTKELVDNKAKEESCDNEDILPSIKRRKTKDSSNEDNKVM